MIEHAINVRLPAAFYKEKAQVRPKERNIVILRQECFACSLGPLLYGLWRPPILPRPMDDKLSLLQESERDYLQ
jgi:hypothetical protein